MEALVFVAILAVIFITVQNGNRISEILKHIRLLHDQLKFLQNKLDSLEGRTAKETFHREVVEKPIPPVSYTPMPDVSSTIEPLIPAQDILEEQDEMIPPSIKPEYTPVFSTRGTEDIKQEDTLETEEPFVLRRKVKQEPRAKTNLEQFIAEKLISIVGIAILVLGIFFIVKWAIGRHLITNSGKVFIGLISGAILMTIAHRLVKNYRTFSSILAGGAIAVFYFSVYEAFQAYHLISQPMAFACMILITVAANTLAVLYDKQELAIIALIGGFSTPFLVSNGSGQYTVLFTYLLILHLGLFGLAWFKKWKSLHVISYFLTIIIFAAWVVQDVSYNMSMQKVYHGLLFATLFYFVFFISNLIYNVRKKETFSAFDILLLLSCTFLYYGAGYYFLGNIHHGDFQGIFTMLLAVFHCMWAWIFYKRRFVDPNLIYLLIGLVLTFVSLTAPIQLHGHYITLFWACEFVLLFWLGLKSGIPLLKQSSVMVLALCIISLLLDWNQYYFMVHRYPLPIVVNKAMIVGMVVLAALGFNYRLLKQENPETVYLQLVTVSLYRNMLAVLGILVLYLSVFLEIQYQFETRIANGNVTILGLFSYHFVFVLLLFIYAKNKVTNTERTTLLAIAFVTLTLFMISNDASSRLRASYLSNTLEPIFYWMHLIPFIVTLILGYHVWRYTSTWMHKRDSMFEAICWFLSIMLVIVLSAELVQLWIVWANTPDVAAGILEQRAIKTGWPMLWSILSFCFMFYGMKKRWKLMRIISLTLFSITIIKLFLYDISNVGQGGKIAAFICLGVLLLIVSFLYQKIKGLFLEEEDHEHNADSL